MDQDEIGLTNLVAESQGVEIPQKTETTETSETETKTEPAETQTPAPAANEETAKPTADESTESSTEQTKEPSQTETETTEAKPAEGTETETKTETQESTSVDDWKKNLPLPPAEFNLEPPQIDPETGQITNMNSQQYEDYIVAKAAHGTRVENYNNTVENRALDEAEKILPEMKTNPEVRKLVENQRIAQVVNGQQGDAVAAAQVIKNLIGEARTEGAQNTKTQITVQKQAAVETPEPSNQQTTSKSEKLSERVNAGDEEAAIELLSMWDKNGSLSQPK